MNGTKRIASIVFFVWGAAWLNELHAQVENPNDFAVVARGGNQFAADLYQKLTASDQSNLFFSPYSISSALAMTYVGAEGQTKFQMSEVLHFPEREQQLQATMKQLRENLISNNDKAGFQLRVANRLWGQNGFPFLPEFLQVTKTTYGAELGLLDFKQSEVARSAINAWVDEQTDHRIQNLIAPNVLDASTRLVLTNAIFFKARWGHEFNKSLTSDAPFHVSETMDVEAPMMRQTHDFRYVESENAQILELPYGLNGNLSMLVLLPKKNDGLPGLEKQISAENLEKWISGLKSANVEVQLPKFKMTSEFSLADVLKSMGMSLAFSDQADFSKMSSSERLFISAVIHKAFVDVHEEGTEAAAATAVAIARSSLQIHPKPPVKFRADHPFLFLIRHTPSNSVLFIGKLVDPKA